MASSVDMLTLLTERINQFSPHLLVRVLQAITSAAATLINAPNTDKKIKVKHTHEHVHVHKTLYTV